MDYERRYGHTSASDISYSGGVQINCQYYHGSLLWNGELVFVSVMGWQPYIMCACYSLRLNVLVSIPVLPTWIDNYLHDYTVSVV